MSASDLNFVIGLAALLFVSLLSLVTHRAYRKAAAINDELGKEMLERKQAEEALRASEEKFRALLESAPDAMVILNGDGDIALVNAQTERMFGYSRDELIGQSIKTVSSEGFRVQPAGLSLHPYGVRKDGTEFAVDVRLSPLRIGEGAFVTASIRDITEQRQAELALRESEEMFRALFEACPDAVTVTDLTATITMANRPSLQLLGLTEEELIGANAMDLVTPDERPRAAEGVSKTLDEGVARNLEYTLVSRDGTRVPIELSTALLRDAQGNPKAFIGVTRDVTERKRAEQALQENQKRTRLIVDTAHDAFIAIDETGVITDWNPQSEATFGWSREEALGTTLAETIVPPQHRKAHRAGLKRFLATGQGAVLNKRIEITALHRDGREFPVELAIRPLQSPDGGYVFNAFVRDITDRKRAEEEIARLSQEIEAITEAVHDVLYVVSPAAKLVWWNRRLQEVTGLSSEELKDRPAVDFFPPEDQPLIAERIRKVFAEGYAEAEAHFLTVDGPTPYHFNGALLKDPQGNTVGLTGVGRDISERKRAEEKLSKLNEDLRRQAAEVFAANKELEAFSYSVSHDLRAPLRSMAGFSQSLLEDYHDKLDAEGQDYLRRVRGAAQRMGQLIDDMLSLSRVTRSEMRYETVDLSALVSAIAADLRQGEPDRKVEFSVEEGLADAGDADLLRIALENLLANAWKFTSGHPSARIEFGASHQNGSSVYFVRDDGAGFDMAYVDKLFGAFQRLHGAEFPGTGIGLATVQRVVRRHGGSVWGEGSPEQGATFYFTLQSDGRGQANG